MDLTHLEPQAVINVMETSAERLTDDYLKGVLINAFQRIDAMEMRITLTHAAIIRIDKALARLSQ